MSSTAERGPLLEQLASRHIVVGDKANRELPVLVLADQGTKSVETAYCCTFANGISQKVYRQMLTST